jgi:hypothetical protein
MYCLSLKDCGNLLQTEGYMPYISPKYSNSPTTLHGVTTHPTTTCVKRNIEERSVPTRRGGGGSRCKLLEPDGPEGAPGPDCFACFCISRQFHYLSTVQINPFRPRPSQSATNGQSFRVSYVLLAGPPLLGGRGAEKLFHRLPRTLGKSA